MTKSNAGHMLEEEVQILLYFHLTKCEWGYGWERLNKYSKQQTSKAKKD